MNFYGAFRHAAALWPENPAIFSGREQRAAFVELEERALRLAGGLLSLGLARGDRVGVVMDNRPEYLEVMLATWAAGLCLVPMNAKLHEREFAYVLANSGARVVLTDAAHMAVVERGAAEAGTACVVVAVETARYAGLLAGEPIGMTAVRPDEAGWLFYTSGTTGRPKGATLTHRNLWLMTLSFIADAGPFSPQTHALLVAPMSHASGLLLMAYLNRGAAAVIPASGSFDPAEMIGLINHFGTAHFFAAPTMVKRFVESPAIGELDLERLDTIVYGGGPMYVADTLRALDVLGPRLWQIYGQGETPCTISYLPKERHADRDHPRYLARLASVGLPRTGIALRILKPDGSPAPAGTVGQIAVQGDTVMSGYWGNEAATADTLRDGWLLTGDLGSLDGDGYLTLIDRAKDLIISGGTNIYPREIEEVLLTHPDVREAAVIGVPHPDWGEEAVAYVVCAAERPDTERARELDQLCLDNIARFKRPKTYRFVQDLPKNSYGKIVKTELRRQELAIRPEGAGA